MFCLSIHRSRCLAYLCVFVRPIFVPQFSPNGTLYSVAQTHCISSSQSFQLTKVGRQVGTQQVGRQVGTQQVGRQVHSRQVGRYILWHKHTVLAPRNLSNLQRQVGRYIRTDKRGTPSHTQTHMISFAQAELLNNT